MTACGGDDDSAEPADEPAEEPAADGSLPRTRQRQPEEPAASDDDVVLQFARFFGDCDEDVSGVTDVSQATTECEVIQIIENAFNAADNGITIEKVGGQAWGDYYTQLSTAFAGGDVPERRRHAPASSARLRRSRPADAARRRLRLERCHRLRRLHGTGSVCRKPRTERPTPCRSTSMHRCGTSTSTSTRPPVSPTLMARRSCRRRPTSCSTSVRPSTPPAPNASPTTGSSSASALASSSPSSSSRAVRSPTTPASATPDSPEGQEALAFLNELTAFSDPQQGYTDSQTAFLNGDAAILHNGTWVVDQYSREAGFNYMATNVPTLYGQPSTWGDSHMWVLPAAANEDPAVAAASVEFLEFLYENIENWAKGTGHIAPRTSLLEGASLADAPQRANYAETASIAGLVPAVEGWAGAWDALAEELNATWVTGKDQGSALGDAAARMNEELGG